MSSFMFGEPVDGGSGDFSFDAPPKIKEVEYVTLPFRPDLDEIMYIRNDIARRMGIIPYMIHSESDFEYFYENIPNNIRCRKRGWAIEVNYRGKTGAVRKTFIVRVLKSPLYEIERQKEYDAAEMKKLEDMRISEIKEAIAESEDKSSSEKVNKLDDEKIMKLFQQAKAAAEQSANVPPTLNIGLDGLNTIPIDENDDVKRNYERKEKIDDKMKSKEMSLLNSFNRNLKSMKSVISDNDD